MAYAPLEQIQAFKIGDELITSASLIGAVGFSGNLQIDLAENPSWIAYWGGKTAKAKRFYDEVQSSYRIARETFIGQERASAKAKITKEVAEERWRVAPGYPSWYERIQDAEYAWNIASYLYDACVKKSFTLAAMAKVQLDEMTALARARGAGPPPPR